MNQPTAPIPISEAIQPVSMRVYIAGPYTVPNPDTNTETAMEVYLQLMRKGHYPFCPHLSHFPDKLAKRLGRPVDYEQWMELDLVWLAQCDVLLRLPGASSGADRECAEADRLGIPIYLSISDIPNVTNNPDEFVPTWTAPTTRTAVPIRTHCKSCGDELTDKIKKPRAPTAPCEGCQSLDCNKCPDCKVQLSHPGCGNALVDLGYDRLCTTCFRTFVWGDPRYYGPKPRQK